MLSSGHIELLAAEGNGPTAKKMGITFGIAYQKLLKTIVKPPIAQRSLNNLLGISSVSTGQKFICSQDKLQLNRHYAHSSTRY